MSKLRKSLSPPDSPCKDGYTVTVHEILIVETVRTSSNMVAKMLAAEQALTILRNPELEHSLSRLCNCRGGLDYVNDSANKPALLLDGSLLIRDELWPGKEPAIEAGWDTDSDDDNERL